MFSSLLVAAVVMAGANAAPAADAGTTTVHVSGAAIGIPNPPGLKALRNQSSPYYRFGAALQSNNKNELLASFLPAKEAGMADADELPTANHWAIVYALGPIRGRAFTEAQFQELVPQIEAAMGKIVRSPELQKKLGEAADESTAQLGRDLHVETGKLRLGVITPYGVYDRNPKYVTFGAATRLRVEPRAGATEEWPIVMVLAYVVVQERLFCFGVYRRLFGSNEVEATRADAKAWAEAIARANP
jgi:hypothetical protein